MAPGRKRATARGAAKASARDKRVDAFLKDFDREVRARVAQVRAEGESLKKDVENLCNMELLRLPLAVRDLNWIEFLALGGGEKALEKVASVSDEVDIAEITQLASRAIQTPFRVAKKGQPGLGWGWGAGGGEESPPDAQTSTKRPPNSKRTRPPSSRAKNFPKRSSGGGARVRLTSPASSPPPSIFRTPGLRAPAAHERVFSISVNGSPLADRSEVFLTVPLGGGEVRGTGKGGRGGFGTEALRPLHGLEGKLLGLGGLPAPPPE
uniref:Borealin n=1 Tax=Pseudonaja textilis TaxID=8673 RepID=A0A670YY58_PSETE